MNNFKLEENFIILETIGKGAFSVVYKVKRKKSKLIYALKKVPLKSLKKKEIENSLNEIRILASINHTNIVGYREAFFDKSSQELCIIMDYAGGGDLSKQIIDYKKKKIRFPEKMIIRFFYQMASALYELHIRNIIHRDLKTANIFLTGDLKNIKLGDMNVSKVVKNIFAYTQTGTPYYASPEVWRDEPYNLKTDIWSLGCVVYEMCMLKPPFRSTDMDGLFEKVQKGKIDPFDDYYSQELIETVSQCLIINPYNRPSCEKILNFPIFNNLSILFGSSYTFDQNNENVFNENCLIDTIKVGKKFYDFEKYLPQAKYKEIAVVNNKNNSGEGEFKLDKKSNFFKKKPNANLKFQNEPSHPCVKKENQSMSRTKKKQILKDSPEQQKHIKTFIGEIKKKTNQKIKPPKKKNRGEIKLIGDKKFKEKSKLLDEKNKPEMFPDEIKQIEILKNKIEFKTPKGKKLSKERRTSKDKNISNIQAETKKNKKFILLNVNKRKLHSAINLEEKKKKSKSIKYRIQSNKNPQIIQNLKLKNKSRATSSKLKPVKSKNLTNLKIKLKKHSDYLNLLLKEKSISNMNNLKKDYFPSIKTSVNPSINLLSQKIRDDKNLSAMWKLSNSKSIELQKSLKSLNQNNNKLTNNLKKSYINGQKIERPHSLNKKNTPPLQNLIKKFRIKSSKNKVFGKKLLIKNFSNIDKKSNNIFVNYSINQNMCLNVKNKKLGQMNLDNFIDFLKINNQNN